MQCCRQATAWSAAGPGHSLTGPPRHALMTSGCRAILCVRTPPDPALTSLQVPSEGSWRTGSLAAGLWGPLNPHGAPYRGLGSPARTPQPSLPPEWLQGRDQQTSQSWTPGTVLESPSSREPLTRGGRWLSRDGGRQSRSRLRRLSGARPTQSNKGFWPQTANTVNRVESRDGDWPLSYS